MNEKIAIIKSKIYDKKDFRELINKSVNFWKHDVKIPRPCCSREISDSLEISKNVVNSTEELKIINQKSKQSLKDLFKTVRSSTCDGKIETSKNLKVLNGLSSIRLKRKEKLKYNDWKPEEDILLMKLCNSRFHKKWKKIAIIIGGKTPRKCAYRIKKLEKTMDNFEIMMSKLNRCGENDLIKEYRNQFKRLSSQKNIKKRKKLRLAKVDSQYKVDLNLALNHLENLKLAEWKTDKLEQEILSLDNCEKLTTDFEMKNYMSNNSSDSNKSMESSNSTEKKIDLKKDKKKFKEAFLKVFSFQESENNNQEEINTMDFAPVKESKENCEGNFLENYFSFNDQVKRKTYQMHSFDDKEVEEILNNTGEENRIIILTNYLMELNEKSRNSDSVEEKKNLMLIQAKVLELMIISSKLKE